jgi:hypothetical protein
MLYVRARNKYREYRKLTQRENLLAGAWQTEDRLSHIPQEAVAAFSQHVRSMIALARGNGAKVVLLSFATLHDPALTLASPELFKTLSLRQKQELLALAQFAPGLTIPAIFEGVRTYNDALRRTAAAEGTGWVDAAQQIPHEDRYFLDRVHFTAEGAQEMARHLAPAVLACLEKSAPPPVAKER